MTSPTFQREITGKGVARSSSAAVALSMQLRGDDEWPACPYQGHRETDWRLAGGGPVVCGVCHPPALRLEVVRIEEAGTHG